MRVSTGFLIGAALMLLLAPLQWVIACAAAAAFHECCHYAAIRMLAGRTARVRLFSYAAKMPLPEMSPAREALCALAGPAGGLCLTALAPWMPRLAVCAAIQSVYNLLPIYPLDGGRALRCGLGLLLPPNIAEKVCGAAEGLCILAIVILAVYASVWLKLGVFPLLLAGLLLIRVK